MDKSLLELQAKLDEAKSKGLINADIDKLQKQINKLKLKTEIDPKSISNLVKQLEAITGQQLGKAIIDSVQKTIDSENINTDKLNADIKTAINSLNTFASKNAGFDAFKAEINGAEISLDTLIAKFSTVDNENDLSTLISQATALKTAFTEQVGGNFFDNLKSKLGFLSTYLNVSNVLAKGLSAVKKGISSVVSLDPALVDLRETTTMTAKELEDFYYSSNDVAKQMGVTTAEILTQAAAWSRLGFSSAEAATQMAKLSSQFVTISPGMTTDEATTSLVSIMKAYDIEVNDVLDGIMSKINDVGNKFATSNAEIAEGLRLSSAAMASTGATIEDNIALFAGAQEIVHNAPQVGNAIRSIALRIRGFDEDTEELSDDLVDVSGQVANLTKVASNGNIGISLFTDSSQTEYKSLVQYLGEISDIWDELDQKTQNDLLEKLFGKNCAQVGAAIIQNMDAVRESMDVMANSAGSADREMSIAMDSIDYKMNMLKETGTGIAQNLFGREEIKTVLDGINSLGKGIDWLTDKWGLFGTLGAGAGLFALYKNVDYLKTPVCPLHI